MSSPRPIGGPKRPTRHANEFEPARGRDVFALTEMIKAETDQHETKARNQIALIFVVVIAFALLAGFALSMERDDFTPLRTVWGVSAFFLGLIAGHYFRRHRKD